jgi:hypothetical protein
MLNDQWAQRSFAEIMEFTSRSEKCLPSRHHIGGVRTVGTWFAINAIRKRLRTKIICSAVRGYACRCPKSEKLHSLDAALVP